MANPRLRGQAAAAVLWLPVLISAPVTCAVAWNPSTAPAQIDGQPVAPDNRPAMPGYGPPPAFYYGYPTVPPGRLGGHVPGRAPESAPAIAPESAPANVPENAPANVPENTPAAPGAAPAEERSGGQPSSSATTFGFAGMTLTQDRTDAAYSLDIALGAVEPQQVKIQPLGSMLLIVAERSVQASREEQFDDGRGFRRSYSYSSGRSIRRLPVPPDADLAALQREDSDGRIQVIIPRTGPTRALPTPQPEQP